MAQELLNPSADGTLSTWTDVPSGDAHYLDIDDYATGSHDGDTSYVAGPNKTAAQMYVELSNTSGLFDPDQISGITIRIAARKDTTGNDTIVLFVQVFKADEIEALTSEVAVNGGASLTTGYVEYLPNLTQQGVPVKADWDGARLRLRQVWTTVGGADATSLARVTAARVEINWTPAQPQLTTLTATDAERSFANSTTGVTVTMSEAVKRATAGGYAVGADIPGLVVRRIYGGELTDYQVRYVSGDLNTGAATFVVDIPVVFRKGDEFSIAYDADATGAELVAVDDAQEAQSMSLDVTNTLTARFRRRLQVSDGSPAGLVSVKWALSEFGNGDPDVDPDYMLRWDKGTTSTDQEGWLDVEYTGTTAPLGVVFGDFEYAGTGFNWPVVID